MLSFRERSSHVDSAKIENIELPKIIHFIWAGGSRQMPILNQQRVRDWANKHSEFQTYIWVDYISALGSAWEEKKAYVEKEYKKPLGLENPDSGLLVSCNNIKLKDVSADLYGDNPENDLTYEFFRYDIDRLRPNYGASSDLLRYKILYELGGAYFDSDILAGENKLDKHVNFGELDQHIIYLDPNSQNQDFIGNDAFIVTTTHNPIMQKILEECFESYCDPEHIKITKEDFCKYYDNCEFIAISTISRTGPQMVINVFGSDGYKYFDYFKEKQSEKYGCLIFPLNDKCRNIQANERNWIGTTIRAALSKQETLDKIVNSGVIEYKYFNILRINYHFYNYYQIFNQPLSIETFLHDLKQKLNVNRLDFSTLQVQELQGLNYWKNNLTECGDSVKEVLSFFDNSDPSQRDTAIRKFNTLVDEQKSFIESYKNRLNSPRLV